MPTCVWTVRCAVPQTCLVLTLATTGGLRAAVVAVATMTAHVDGAMAGLARRAVVVMAITAAAPTASPTRAAGVAPASVA